MSNDQKVVWKFFSTVLESKYYKNTELQEITLYRNRKLLNKNKSSQKNPTTFFSSFLLPFNLMIKKVL